MYVARTKMQWCTRVPTYYIPSNITSPFMQNHLFTKCLIAYRIDFLDFFSLAPNRKESIMGEKEEEKFQLS